MKDDGKAGGGVFSRLWAAVATNAWVQSALITAIVVLTWLLLERAGVEMPRRATGTAGAHDRRLLEAEKELKEPKRIQVR